MVEFIRDTGHMINSMAKAKRLGQMEPNSLVYTIRVRERAMVQCTLRTEPSTRVTSSIMKFMAKVDMNGPMGRFMKEAGNSIK